ncbi:hypothetical protein KI387_020211, partial [Taxus chinensis]
TNRHPSTDIPSSQRTPAPLLSSRRRPAGTAPRFARWGTTSGGVVRTPLRDVPRALSWVDLSLVRHGGVCYLARHRVAVRAASPQSAPVCRHRSSSFHCAG